MLLSFMYDVYKSILSPETFAHGNGHWRAWEPTAQANGLATPPVTVRLPSYDLLLSALFFCLA